MRQELKIPDYEFTTTFVISGVPLTSEVDVQVTDERHCQSTKCTTEEMANLLQQSHAVFIESLLHGGDRIWLFVDEPLSDVFRSRYTSVAETLPLPLQVQSEHLLIMSEETLLTNGEWQTHWRCVGELTEVPSGDYDVEVLSQYPWIHENYNREVHGHLTRLDYFWPRAEAKLLGYALFSVVFANLIWSLPHFILIARFNLWNGVRFGGIVLGVNAFILGNLSKLAAVTRVSNKMCWRRSKRSAT